MIDYFDLKEWETAKAQKNKVFALYTITLVLYVVFAVVMYVWFLNLPYGSNKVFLIKWILFPITFLFTAYSFIYFGIPYKRVKKYHAKCIDLATGIKETSGGTFLRYCEIPQVKDGVDFKSLVFSEWNKYKCEYYERKVLVFMEKPFPEIPINEEVKYITQGNVLISYEIKNKESV